MVDKLLIIVPPILGALSYVTIVIVSRRSQRALLFGAGFWALVTVALFIVAKFMPNEGFNALGYFLLSMFFGIGFIAFLFSWGVDTIIRKMNRD